MNCVTYTCLMLLVSLNVICVVLYVLCYMCCASYVLLVCYCCLQNVTSSIGYCKHFQINLYPCIYIYIYICVYMCVCVDMCTYVCMIHCNMHSPQYTRQFYFGSFSYDKAERAVLLQGAVIRLALGSCSVMRQTFHKVNLVLQTLLG